MEKKTIRIRAAADAPDEVAIGNLIARKEHGYYETDHEAFGDYIRSNFGIHPADDEAAAAFAEPSADSTAAEIPDMEQNDKPEKKGGKK